MIKQKKGYTRKPERKTSYVLKKKEHPHRLPAGPAPRGPGAQAVD